MRLNNFLKEQQQKEKEKTSTGLHQIIIQSIQLFHSAESSLVMFSDSCEIVS